MFTVDRYSTLSLTDQIVQQFTSSAGQGTLRAGSRLPSIRQFAEKVGVSPYTVVNAYDRLIALGLVEHSTASGFYVSSEQARGGASTREPVTTPAAELDAAWLSRCVADLDGAWVAAGSGQLPSHWLEDIRFGHLLSRTVRGQAEDMLRPLPAQGLHALRVALSCYLRQEKIHVEPENILTTSGATHALDLICRALLSRGDTVVVEIPTHPLLLGRLEQEGVNVVGIERSPEGLDIAALEDLCKTQAPKMVFTQSVLHNPTGWSASTHNIFRVLSLADRYGFTIAEDDTYGDLASGGHPRFAHLSALDNVVYYRSFTKAASSFARVGFVSAKPAKIKALTAAKMASVSSSSGVDERILLELLQEGRYRKHTERLAQRLAAARISTIRALGPSGLRVEAEGEGMYLWASAPGHVNMDSLVRDAHAHKILLAPGSLFAARGPVHGGQPKSFASFLRFNVSVSNNLRLVNFLADRIGTPGAAALASLAGDARASRPSGERSAALLESD